MLLWTSAMQAGAQGWMADCSKAAIPNKPAAGMIHGAKFVVEKVELSGGSSSVGGSKMDHGTYFLKLRQGKEFFADREFTIFIATKLGDKLDGKSFTGRSGFAFDQPGAIKVGNVTYPPIQGVQMSWKPPKETLPKTDITSKYTLRLQFGQKQGNKLPGRIYLCMQDKEKSFVAGTFTAVIVK